MKLRKVLLLVLVCIMCVSLVGCGTAPSTTTSEEVVENDEVSKQEDNRAVEKVFVDDDNCTFKITDIDSDNIWGYTLKVDLENKTEKNLMFSLDKVSVNGYMCDPFWAESVQAGKKAKSEISFNSQDFEELGIDKVEEIEFTLSVYDEDNWEAAHLIEEKFIYIVEE